MMFVSLLKAKPQSSTRARTARRLDWKYPEGVKVLGEYWLTTDHPKVVFVSEADDPGAIMNMIAEWDDVFEIDVFPAVTAEEGIANARRRLAAARA